MNTAWLHLALWQSLAPAQRQQVLALQLLAAQQEFAGSIERAVAAVEDALPDEVAGLAMLRAGQVIGFEVLSRGNRRPDWAPEGAVALTAMRIAPELQGQGLGQAALGRVADWLDRHWPGHSALALCVDESNAAGRRAYAGAGFTEYTTPRPGRIGQVHYLSRPLGLAAGSPAPATPGPSPD